MTDLVLGGQDLTLSLTWNPLTIVFPIHLLAPGDIAVLANLQLTELNLTLCEKLTGRSDSVGAGWG